MKIAEKAKVMVAGLTVMTAGVVGAVAPVSAASFTCPDGQTGTGTDYTTACKQHGIDTTQETDLMGTLNTIINVVIGVVGFIAVVMIILGGVQYTTSAGDTAKVTKAKNTIMYGVIGLVIALLAFAIVNFVLGNVFGK